MDSTLFIAASFRAFFRTGARGAGLAEGDAARYLVAGRPEKTGQKHEDVVAFLRHYCKPSRPNVALAWKDSLATVPHLKVLPATLKDLNQAWSYFERPALHQLSAVDAVSFVLMTQRRIRLAFAFDSHFATAGFRMVG